MTTTVKVLKRSSSKAKDLSISTKVSICSYYNSNAGKNLFAKRYAWFVIHIDMRRVGCSKFGETA